MSTTPRTDAEVFVPHDSKFEVVDVDFSRALERESDARLKVLRDIMPYVLVDYYPECATAEFKAALKTVYTVLK